MASSSAFDNSDASNVLIGLNLHALFCSQRSDTCHDLTDSARYTSDSTSLPQQLVRTRCSITRRDSHLCVRYRSADHLESVARQSILVRKASCFSVDEQSVTGKKVPRTSCNNRSLLASSCASAANLVGFRAQISVDARQAVHLDLLTKRSRTSDPVLKLKYDRDDRICGQLY